MRNVAYTLTNIFSFIFFYIREGKTYHFQELHTRIYKAIYLFVYLRSLKEGSP